MLGALLMLLSGCRTDAPPTWDQATEDGAKRSPREIARHERTWKLCVNKARELREQGQQEAALETFHGCIGRSDYIDLALMTEEPFRSEVVGDSPDYPTILGVLARRDGVVRDDLHALSFGFAALPQSPEALDELDGELIVFRAEGAEQWRDKGDGVQLLLERERKRRKAVRHSGRYAVIVADSPLKERQDHIVLARVTKRELREPRVLGVGEQVAKLMNLANPADIDDPLVAELAARDASMLLDAQFEVPGGILLLEVIAHVPD